jgi:peptidylprolyl isomerase
MRKLAGSLGVVFMLTAAIAQPAEQPKQPGSTPPAPPATPAPQAPAAQPGAAPTTPAAPAQPAKRWEIAADAKPVARQELEGGLIVEDFVAGTGAEVKPGAAVLAFYHGMIKSSGQVFQSAFEQGRPVPFSLNGVIPGWMKGVPGMKVGGLRRLTIPAALAYADHPPQGSGIAPNSDLVFVIEVVDQIQAEDTKVGTGEEVGVQGVCTTSYVMKDSSGKEIDKTAPDAPYVWLPNENPFNLGFIGMKVGGKRTLNVPATMNMQNPQYPKAANTPPSAVPVTVEVELLAVRNLAPVKSNK